MSARSLNHMRDKVERARQISNDMSKMRSEIYNMDKELKRLNAEIMKSLGDADTGNIDSQPVLDKSVSNRRSVSVKTVEEQCPELYDVLVTVSNTVSIKFRK